MKDKTTSNNLTILKLHELCQINFLYHKFYILASRDNMEANGIPGVIKEVVHDMITEVANRANEDSGKHSDISPLSQSPGRRSNDESRRDLHTTTNKNKEKNTVRVLQFETPESIKPTIPEEISESLHFDGYDSDGYIPYIDNDLEIEQMDVYNNIAVGSEVGTKE